MSKCLIVNSKGIQTVFNEQTQTNLITLEDVVTIKFSRGIAVVHFSKISGYLFLLGKVNVLAVGSPG